MEELENLNQHQENFNNNNNIPNQPEVNHIQNNLNENNFPPRPLRTPSNTTIDNSIKLLYSKNFIILSLTVTFGIVWYLYICFSDKDIHLKDLESEDMLFSYFLITIVCSALIWNVFLLIHKLIFKLDYQNIEEMSGMDSLYFNPIFFNLFLYFLNKQYMLTSFDIFAWWLISYTYGISFLFTLNLYNFSNFKINTITNFQEHDGFLYKMRLNYITLLLINIGFFIIMKQLLEEADFSYKYIILFKGFYLLMKQVEFWLLNEINLIQLKVGSCEDFIFRTNTIRLYIQIINMVLILHIYIIGNNFYLYNGSYLLFFIFTLLIVKFMVEIRLKYKSYQNFKEFMSKLDSIFPKIPLEGNDHEECTICKENLTNARKLSCNHYFHLICLSKWIEKGNKSCPLCRKEIEISLTGNEASNFWSFGFRVQTNSIFSWLPNFSLRIIRTTGSPITEDTINTVSNIFPNIPREEISASLNRTRNIHLTINEFLLR